jgi:hypothetical protein
MSTWVYFDPQSDAPMDVVKTLCGIFGGKDSGQTNDGPLVWEGKLLLGHASFEIWVNPDHGPANRDEVSREGRQAFGEPGP